MTLSIQQEEGRFHDIWSDGEAPGDSDGDLERVLRDGCSVPQEGPPL